MPRRKPYLGIIGLIIFIFILFVYTYFPNSLPQSSLDRLDEVKTPLPGERVLVFAPHPDDETIAVGGYIYRASRSGALVKVVLVTDGNKHGQEERRYQEFRAATEILGLSGNQLSFWGYPDGSLKGYQEQLAEQVKKELADFLPDVLLYPHPADRHPDHAVLGRVVEDQLHQSTADHQQPISYCYLVHYRHFPQHRLGGRPTKLLPPLGLLHFDQHWQRFDLTAEEKAVKEKALEQYQTQLENPFLRSLFQRMLRDNELLASLNTQRRS